MATSIVENFTIAAGAVSVASVPVASDAMLKTINHRPLSVSLYDGVRNGSLYLSQATWDVDGHNGPDFALMFFGGDSDTGSEYTRDARLNISARSLYFTSGPYRWNSRQLNGLGLVNSFAYRTPYGSTVSNLAPLGKSAEVDSGANFKNNGAIGHVAVFKGYKTIKTYSSTYSYQRLINSRFWHFDVPGTYNIGFAFNAVDGAHFGWASLEIGGPYSFVTTIRDWTYETTPDTAVHVGTRAAVVPAPPSGIAALTLLGLGAAGVQRWRKQKVENGPEVALGA